MTSAEIIAVGSELLKPEKIDTNSLWFTEKLNEIGIQVRVKVIVGDEIETIKQVVQQSLTRSELIILTGGLGPTQDDVTREAVARAVNRELIYRPEIAELIRQKFALMNRPMLETNKRQAYIIDGARVLHNENGTAVGMHLELEADRMIVLLPGPPRENQPMFEKQVLPVLRAKTGNVVFKRRILRVSGMGESAVDEAIAPIYSKYESIETTILFNRSEIEIHLMARADSEEKAIDLLDDLTSEIVGKLGIAVFATNGETMEEVVGELLKSRGETVAVAESCTGGLIGMRLTEVPGSSAYFLQGVIAYSNEAKVKLLGVDENLIKAHGAVSAEVAEAMARGILIKSGSDYAISVTGIAGPGGGTPEKPVGLVFIGYADREQAKSLKVNLPGDRYLIRWRASQMAMDYLRRKILQKEDTKI